MKVLLDEGNLKITDTYIQASGGETFQLRSINSVYVTEVQPSRAIPTIKTILTFAGTLSLSNNGK